MTDNDIGRHIVVTGFGPFRDIDDNPSWKCVKLFSEECNEIKNYKIIAKQLEVSYEHVEEKIPELWRTKPEFMIHVGVSSLAECVVLESRARSQGYCHLDVNGKLPSINKSSNNETRNICYNSKFDLNGVCQQLKDSGIKSIISDDAGLFLCEFIFCKSLCCKSNCNQKSIFIHVPLENNPYSIEQLASALKIIVNELLKQSEKL